MNNQNYLIGVFYSPKPCDVQFFDSFNFNVEKAMESSKNLIIVGDLNEDLLNPNYHKLRNVLMENSLYNIISEPTRGRAFLDPIIIPDDL